MRTSDIRRVSREHSFTLVETVVAVGLLAFLLLQVVGVQGNAIYAGEYGRKSMQAAWLAKRVMAQVEYNWAVREFKDLKIEVKETPFDDVKEFNYTLVIQEFKLPIEEMLMGALGGDAPGKDGAEGGESGSDGEGKDSGMGALASFAEGPIKQCLGDERLMTAVVDVSWPVGARKDSVGLAMMLTNQKKIEECIAGMGAMLPAGAGGAAGGGALPEATPTPSVIQ